MATSEIITGHVVQADMLTAEGEALDRVDLCRDIPERWRDPLRE
jgi:hypothetical protein